MSTRAPVRRNSRMLRRPFPWLHMGIDGSAGGLAGGFEIEARLKVHPEGRRRPEVARQARVAAAAPLLPAARALFAIYYFHLGGMLSGFVNREQFFQALHTDLELLLTGLASK